MTDDKARKTAKGAARKAQKARRLGHWDRRFMGLARFIAAWSKDPSTQVGCVVADPMRRIVSTGFNGFPTGVEDTIERLQDRSVKYEMMVHAERNAIIDAKRNLSGMTLYVWPIMPCSVCAAMIIQAGIGEVVAPRSDDARLAATCHFDLTETMFREAGVTLTLVPEDFTPNIGEVGQGG